MGTSKNNLFEAKSEFQTLKHDIKHVKRWYRADPICRRVFKVARGWQAPVSPLWNPDNPHALNDLGYNSYLLGWGSLLLTFRTKRVQQKGGNLNFCCYRFTSSQLFLKEKWQSKYLLYKTRSKGCFYPIFRAFYL